MGKQKAEMKNTKIEWCEHTFNPWVGCSPVSAGCEHCYAAAGTRRWRKDFAVRTLTGAGNWRQPVLWNREAKAAGRKATVFCGSMCDWLDETVPENWRLDLWALIQNTPHLFWLLLTKRPENYSKLMRGYMPPNVGFGVTVEHQAAADERIPMLLTIPARLRFVSVEPMLGPVDLMRVRFPTGVIENVLRTDVAERAREIVGKLHGVDWVICGAETGPGAREMDNNWACDLEVQCARTGVPFFFKKPSKGHILQSVRQFPACCADAQGAGKKGKK